ncbi:Immunoglobulin-like domain [Trinorchestia longiramus]|nr:Immunoglobulin-like domain [Trinorchestia longiramus]
MYRRHRADMVVLLLLCVLPVFLPPCAGVDVPVVSIEGTAPNENYLMVGRKYELVCSVRAGYDETITAVKWHLYDRQVYSWSETAGVRVSPPLLGHVLTQREGSEAYNIAVTSPSLSMAGNYICSVESTKETVQSDFITVYVIEIGAGDYETKVELLSNILLSTTTYTPGIPALQPSNETVESPGESIEMTTFMPPPIVTSRPESVTPQPEVPLGPTVPPADCILVWWFHTPAIAPRPVVKCGFYDHTSNSLTKEVPGGLLMNQLPNGSWRAQIDSTRIPVSTIPPNQRLGCIVTIPNTSYREVVKFEDGLTIDSTIDLVGCPSLSELQDWYGFQVSVTGDSVNCRGDHVPQSETSPAVATIGCPSAAVFKNNTQEIWNWRLRLVCSERQTTWRLDNSDMAGSPASQNEGASGSELSPSTGADGMGEEFDIRGFEWPYCVGSISSASVSFYPNMLLLLLFLFILHLQRS